MRQEVLVLMKKQLHNIADNLTLENLKEMESETYKVFTVLEAAEAMLDTPVHQTAVPVVEEQTLPPLISKILEEEDEPDMTMEELFEEEDEESVPNPTDAHRFERRIKGGVIPDIEAFVPEMIVRQLDLCHGDMVKATFLYKPDNGPTRYDFQLVEKAEPPCTPDNIVEVNMGIISYEPRYGGYAIRKTVTLEEIFYEGEPLVLPISEDDIRTLDLREGDIVNAAFYANNPEYVRVRWKYSIDEVEEEKATPKRSSSFYKKKDEDDREELEQIFKGKVIACMGYEPGHPGFREEVESRGGEFIGLTGREGADTLASQLRKSDCLVMILLHVGHTGTKWAVPFCKENNIPYDSMKTFGRSMFVDTAANLLGK